MANREVDLGRRNFLKFGALVSLMGAEGLVVACSKSNKATPKKEEWWSPGKLEQEIVIKVKGAQGEKISLKFSLFTTRKITLNDKSLENVLNLFASQDGILPEETKIVLTDKDLPINSQRAEVLGQTNSELNLIAITLKRVFSSDLLYQPQPLANGVLVGELCNLMFSKAPSLQFLKTPPTQEDIQLSCDSFGLMSVVILSGKTYEQYQSDLRGIGYADKPGSLGVKGKILNYDRGTYQVFQKALENPILNFE